VDTILTDLTNQATVRVSMSVDTASTKLVIGASYSGVWTRGGATNWTTQGIWYAPGNGVYGVNSSPAVTKNCVIFGEEKGVIRFCKKDSVGSPYTSVNLGYSAHELWSYTLASGKAVEASPAVSNGKVVVGSLDGCLYGFWNGTQVTAPVRVDSGGSGIAKSAIALPGQWTLSVFPNPAAGNRVMIEMSGTAPGAVIAVHDISGALVAELKAGRAGKFPWDLKDLHGRSVAAGAYFAMVKGPGGSNMRSFNLQVLR
jgi:hypothetical protein